jgi:hypothetical protein
MVLLLLLHLAKQVQQGTLQDQGQQQQQLALVRCQQLPLGLH